MPCVGAERVRAARHVEARRMSLLWVVVIVVLVVVLLGGFARYR